MVQHDPRVKITEALTDEKERTDMLSAYVSKEQKRYDTHLKYGSTVYGIPHYDEILLTDRRQQMAMVSRTLKPRSEQLKEAMTAGTDRGGIYTGTRGANEEMDAYQERRRKG